MPIITSTYLIFERATAFAAAFSGLLLLSMMALGVADVAGGKLVNMPVAGAFELTEMLLASAALLPMARVLGAGGMIRVELLYSKFPATIQMAIDRLTSLLWAVAFGILAWQGWVNAWRSLQTSEYASGAVPFPVAPAKILLAVALTLTAIQGTIHIFRQGKHQGGQP